MVVMTGGVYDLRVEAEQIAVGRGRGGGVGGDAKSRGTEDSQRDAVGGDREGWCEVRAVGRRIEDAVTREAGECRGVRVNRARGVGVHDAARRPQAADNERDRRGAELVGNQRVRRTAVVPVPAMPSLAAHEMSVGSITPNVPPPVQAATAVTAAILTKDM